MSKDLGLIGYTDVNSGTRPVDRSLENRVFDQALGVTKKIVDESILAKAGGEAEDILDAQAEGAMMEQGIPPEPLWERGSEEEHIFGRIDRLNAIIAQGKQSQRTAAEMQIRALQTKVQAKYPWLRDELARRIGSTVAGSERMLEIGMAEQARGAAAQNAQAELDDLLDNARKAWKDGGMAMPVNLSPNDPEFYRLYGERARMRARDNNESVLTAMALVNANADFNNPYWYGEMQDSLQSAYGQIENQIMAVKQEYGWPEVVKILREGAGSANLGELQKWQATNLPLMIEGLQAEKQTVLDVFNTWFTPEMRATDRGKAFEKVLNDELSVFDTMIAGLQKFGDDMPSAAQIIDTALAVRANALYEAQTERNKNFMAWSMTPYGKLALEFSGSIANPGGMTLLQDFGVANQSMLAAMDKANFDPSHPDYIANVGSALYNSEGILQIKPGTSGQDIIQAMEGRLVDPNSSFTIKAKSNEEQTVAAMQTMDWHRKMWKYAEATRPDAGPEFADGVLTGTAYSLVYLNKNPVKYKNVQEEVLRNMAEDSTMNAVTASLKGSDPGRRHAYALAANQFWLNSKPEQRREEARRAYQDQLVEGKVALANVAFIKPSSLESGVLEYEVNREAMQPLVDKYLSQQLGLGFRSESSIRDAEVKAYRAIDEAMRPILKEAKQQIKIEMMLNRARSTDGVFNEKDDFASYFLGQAAPTRGAAWADMFNYSKTGSVSRSN